MIDVTEALQRGKREVASTLAGSSIFWRELPGAFGRRIALLADDLLDGLSGVLLGSAVTITLADLRLFGIGIDLLLYLYLITTFLPNYLPDPVETDGVIGSQGFVGVMSLYVLALAYPVSTVVPDLFTTSTVEIVEAATGVEIPSFTTTDLLPLYVAWVAIGWIGFSIYLYVRWWRTASLNARIELLDQVVPTRATKADHHRADQEQSDLVNTISELFAILAIAGVLIFVCTMFALLTALTVILFPLPELLILFGAFVSALPVIYPTRWRDWVGEYPIVIEDRLFNILKYSRSGPKGLVATVLVFAGLGSSFAFVFISLLTAIFASNVLLTNLRGIWQSLLRFPLRMSVFFLIIGCLITPGLVCLWYWLRQLQRLPFFLDYWSDHYNTNQSGERLAGTSSLPARPPGTLVIPVLLFIPVYLLSSIQSIPPPTPVLVGIAVLAITLLGLVAGYVYRTFHIPPQHPRTEMWALPTAALIQISWFLSLFWIFGQTGPFGYPILFELLAVTVPVI